MINKRMIVIKKILIILAQRDESVHIDMHNAVIKLRLVISRNVNGTFVEVRLRNVQ